MANPTTNFGWVMPTSTDLVTDLPADFAVFGQGVDTTMADLKGGTTGQILAKATNTDMDFTWITNDQGDITEVNTTAPLAGGGTSGALTLSIAAATTSVAGAVQLSDSTSTTSSVLAATPTAVKSAYDLANGAIAKTTVTTAGDIIYRNATVPTRLGIGTAGQVLQVNSGATAPEWATPSSGGMTLLSTTTLTGASVTVSSISTAYNDLKFVFEKVYSATDAVFLYVQLNGDAGNRYAYQYYNTQDSNVRQGSAVAQMEVSKLRNGASGASDGFMLLSNYNTSGTTVGGIMEFTYSSTHTQGGSFTYNNAAVITSVKIYCSSGNISGGTLKIYGVK